MLDFSAQQTELGKTVGDDFRDGKITLPVLLAFRRGDETERALLAAHTRRGRAARRAISSTPSRCSNATARLRDTLARARHYGAIARDALGIFPDGPEKRALLEAVDFCIERAY